MRRYRCRERRRGGGGSGSAREESCDVASPCALYLRMTAQIHFIAQLEFFSDRVDSAVIARVFSLHSLTGTDAGRCAGRGNGPCAFGLDGLMIIMGGGESSTVASNTTVRSVGSGAELLSCRCVVVVVVVGVMRDDVVTLFTQL